MKELQEVLDKILCCPACKCDLMICSDNKLKCVSCHQSYPVKDGIPVLMNKSIGKEQTDEQLLREELAKKHNEKTFEEIIEVVSYHHCLQIMSKKANKFRACFDSSQWILDVGCGTGYYWRNTLSGGSLILIDFAFNNLKVAQTMLAMEQNVCFIQADASNLPIKPCSVSGIWSVQVTQHFPDIVFESFLGEAKRVLSSSFLIEIYNLNPAWLYRILYLLFGKKLHIRGKCGDMILNRLNSREHAAIWRDVFNDEQIRIGYSELFFHPDFRVFPRNKYPVLLENLIATKMPYLAKLFARQISVNLSSQKPSS
jgi:ubiquinone/menaquinone biosynthesis C-methylase UbiE/uncharacterized protein YbaR (Trm112 family)